MSEAKRIYESYVGAISNEPGVAALQLLTEQACNVANELAAVRSVLETTRKEAHYAPGQGDLKPATTQNAPGEGQIKLAEAAVNWWRGRRRKGWSEEEHLAKPKCLVGHPFASDDKLSLAVAEFVRSPVAEREGHDPKHEAVQKLLFALHIYPNYPVDSRGPAGCIHDAIQALEPETVAKLRDGVDPGDLLDRDEDGDLS